MGFFRSRTVWIVPLVLLVVTLFEDVVSYKVRQHVRDVYWRAAILLVLNGMAFAVAAGYIGPWLRDLFTTVRKGSRQGFGRGAGLWIFYAVAYGALFYAFVVAERNGPGGLLPASLR